MKTENNIAKTSFEDIYNLSPGYFVSFSHNGLITHINRNFLENLGYTGEELIGQKTFSDLLTVGSRIFFQTHFYPLIKLHGKFSEIFLSFKTKHDQELPVLLNVKLIGNGEESEIHCSGLQISQRSRFEKELIEAKNVAEKALLENEELNHYKLQLESNLEHLEERLQTISLNNLEHHQISMVISHDLQEPLRKVSILAHKIISTKADILDPLIIKDFLKIDSASKKMRDLVINLQDFLSLNDKHIVTEQVNLSEIICLAEQKLELTSDLNVNIEVGKMPTLYCDKKLLGDLFYNLLHNSLKFRDSKKPELSINIVAEKVEENIFKHLNDKYSYKEFIRITVSDNGIGFSNSLATEIFSLFRKANANEDGLGLGLAYCKKIMGLHNGVISASAEVGKGSTFVLIFPNFI